ncbi:hypothetical protein LV478_00435 (plasmid) [Komagataeibacter oboediens]|uniref:hypothetical protein n=1 Tax=Komagataeibacter oboediens TaxID=65958 RepID=UPI0023DA2FC1|nr:hypothetical protein [Komagataeibacter oboediens]WEQ50724.1 hypothetical protein LV478_00435 [Komagataeibacter oboediens]
MNNINTLCVSGNKTEYMRDRKKNIEKFILNFEVISFDVFDTLLFREVARPEGIFYYIESKTKNKGFAQRRIGAEKLARKINFTRYKSYETTLIDIYRVLYTDPIQQKKGMACELETERHFLKAHKVNKEIYEISKSLNKKIIAISDMYLSEEDINDFLVNNGIFVNKVFSSSTYHTKNICKSNGSIYPFVCEYLNITPEKLVHFGDNYYSDVEQAISSGISAVHITSILTALSLDSNINEKTINIIRTNSSIDSDIIIGMLSRRHYEGYFDDKNPAKSFGYIYGGIIILSFIKNIIEISKKYNIKKLLLMTRDGFIIKKAMDSIGINDVDYETFWSSRRMCLVPLLGDTTQHNWVFPILFPRREGYSYDMRMDLERLHLKVPNDIYNIKETKYDIYIEKLKSLGSFWSEITKEERENYLGYIKHSIGDESVSKVAFVDVGWGISSHRAIDNLLGIHTTGFYIGTHSRAYATPHIHGIFFQEGKPIDLSHSIMGGVELIELMFSDCSPSTMRMEESDQEYHPVFEARSAADSSRDWYVGEIQCYMMDFISDIAPYFSIFSANILKDIAVDSIENIIINPNPNERDFLAGIPHSREVGHSNFLPISYWWRTNKNQMSSSKDLWANWSQAEKESYALHGRVLPKSEMIGRKIMNPVLGEKRTDWLIKTWNRNKRKFMYYIK